MFYKCKKHVNIARYVITQLYSCNIKSYRFISHSSIVRMSRKEHSLLYVSKSPFISAVSRSLIIAVYNDILTPLLFIVRTNNAVRLLLILLQCFYCAFSIHFLHCFIFIFCYTVILTQCFQRVFSLQCYFYFCIYFLYTALK